MTDFRLFDKALKLCWVKRLCYEGDQTWKLIPLRCQNSSNDLIG